MLGLLQRAQESDISLWVEGDDIELSYGDETPDELFINSLRQEKTALIDFLNQKQIFNETAFEAFLNAESEKNGFREFKAASGVTDAIEEEKAANSIEAIFPATSLQQGFVYHYLSQPQDDAYRVQLLLDYQHALSIDLYQEAWRLASLSFPILRTAFDWDGEGDILQVVSKSASIDEKKFSFRDISHLNEAQQEQTLKQALHQDRQTGFDLSKSGMIRFVIFKLNNELYTVLKTEHHIISDGWSSAILLQRVHQYYADLVDGKQPTFVQESAYLNAQAYYAKQADKVSAYWDEARQRFDEPNDLNPMLSYPCDLSQVRIVEHAAETVKSIKGATYLRIKEVCRELGVTMSVLVQFAWHKLINVYTQDDKTTVGTTVSGRDIPVDGIEESVGLYINTLPLVIDWESGDTIEQILKQVHQLSADLNSYSNVPLASLQQDGERLFHSLFVFENFPMAEETIGGNGGNGGNEGQGNNLVSFRQSVGKVDYPLSLTVYDQSDSLILKLEYGEDWLTSSKSEELLEQVERILELAVKDPYQPHQAISPVSEQEYHAQVELWNQTKRPIDTTQCLHHLFEKQALDSPQAIAIQFEGESFTYQEINWRANRLANLIDKRLEASQTQGEQDSSQKTSQNINQKTNQNAEQITDQNTYHNNRLIGIYQRPGVDMVVSMLAVLKCGAAYVPISPEFPAQRSLFILDDTATSLILTEQQLLPSLAEIAAQSEETLQLLPVDSGDIKESLEDYSRQDLKKVIHSHQLAYVIYTSGTTGKPKGVMVAHGSLVNFLKGMEKELNPSQQLVTLGVTSIVFDIFVLEFYLTLMKGGRLVLASEQQRQTPSELIKLIRETRTNLVQLTPSRLQLLLSETSAEEVFEHVELLLVGGEAFPQQYLSKLKSLSKLKLFNVYGPTETTVWSTVKPLTNAERVSLGQPIANTQVYVLGKGQQVLPVGSCGELYIGGHGVTRGYLNRPKLTAERFIKSPFANRSHEQSVDNLLYRTGDIVRWLPNGELEYIGRSDFQVKIRGHRIELGEIEHAIGNLASIKQSVVITKQRDASQYLVAYVVPVSKSSFDKEAIINELASTLPDYMIPDSFVPLESLPITVNGKLDRKKLPEPEFISASNYQAPRTEFEQQLCEVWQDVLGIEKVGINDSFFRIGGNSILAIQLTAAIRNKLEVDIPLAVLLEQKTIKGMADKHQKIELIPETKLSPYPLSFAQERMLFFERFDQGSSAYHIPFFVKLTEEFNSDNMALAINLVVARHPILTTLYLQDELGQDYQTHRDYKADLTPTIVEDEEAFKSKVSAEIFQPFDLSQEASIRTRVFKQGCEQYLLIVWHHIAFDGWSTNVFMQELGFAYEAISKGEEVNLAEPEIRYVDYAAWQRERLQGDFFEDLKDYWLAQLSDFETLNLPTDYDRAAHLSFEGENYLFELDEALSAGIKQVAKIQNASLYSVSLSAFYVLLSRLSGQHNIVVGTPSDNRHHPQTQGLIGLLVNSLALRTDIEPMMSLKDLISRVHQVVTQAKIHEELPFERLLDLLKVDRDTSRHPLFQVMFSMAVENNMVDFQAGLPFSSVILDEETDIYTPAKFDLDLSLNDQGAKITGTLNYAVNLYSRSSITRLVDMYLAILDSMVNDLDQKVIDIELLSDTERQQILHQFNDTDVDYPRDLRLETLFNQQVVKCSDKVALVYEDTQLTYQQLDQLTNRLANKIQQDYQKLHGSNMAAGTFIALYLDRSIETYISILAVLKSGGAYVPISPDYPRERVEFILEDTQTPMIITQKHHLASIKELLTQQTALIAADDIIADDFYDNGLHAGELPADEIAAKAVTISDDSQPQITASADDLAYMIYTSGTTGKPKGVMIEHSAIVSRFYGWKQLYLDDGVDCVLNMADYGFDVATADWIRALCSGARLVICPKEKLLDTPALIDLIKENNVSLADFVPATIRSLVDYLTLTNQTMPPIKHLIVGSDVWNMNDHFKTQQVLDPSTRLFNAYGVTECAVDTSCFTIEPDALTPSGMAIIGRPFANVKVYVLSEGLGCQPAGTPGELYVGGAGLARGYLNRKELTQSRFIENPFASDDDLARGFNRLYKTGDLARWLPDGNLEFLGRNDFQVKIRGFRIELGEIEHALTQLPGIKQAIVIDRDKEGRKYLAAYIVADSTFSESELAESETAQGKTENFEQNIREQLIETLPEYMVPSTFTWLEQIPLTVNGKLDRKNLPEPNWETEQSYIAPRTDTEEQLCDIWKDVLGLDKVSINENFFHIGGDSILSLQIVSRANMAGINITTRMIFEFSTIEKLAAQAQDSQASITISQEASEGEVGLLPIQQDFFSTEELAANKVNQPGFISRIVSYLSGNNSTDTSSSLELQPLGYFHQSLLTSVPQPFEPRFLNLLVEALYHRHDVFRLRFVRSNKESEAGESCNGNPWQASFIPLDNVDISKSIAIYHLNSEDSDEFENEVKRIGEKEKANFNLDDGPLLKVVYLVGVKPEQSRLLWIIHHLVVDGVSWRILLNDLMTAYNQFLANQRIQLATKTTSYQAWSTQLLDYAKHPSLKAEKDFWLKSLAQAVAPIRVDRQSIKDNTNATSASITLELDEDNTSQLLGKCNSPYQTQINELLVTALYLAYHRWQDTDSMRIMMEGHGREDLSDVEGLAETELSETVGWFTSIFPVTLTHEKDTSEISLAQLIPDIKAQFRSIPKNGIGYGVLRYLSRDEEIIAAEKNSVMDILFNYLGQFDDGTDVKTNHDMAFTVVNGNTGSDVSAKLQRTHKLCFNAVVINKRLKVTVDFNRTEFKEKSVNRLLSHFVEELQQVVRHCAMKSDPFYVKDLPQEVLALAKGKGELKRQFEPLVRYNQAADKPSDKLSVFCIPPAGAGAEAYFKLVKKISKNIPISICENVELYTGSLYSLPSLAEYYSQLIINQAPAKQVYLIGASRGAILAHDVAAKLKAESIDVAGVFFIDPIGYTMKPDCMQAISKDTRVTNYSDDKNEILNHSLHLFDYTAKLNKYTGEGIVFQSEGDMQKSGEWADIENLIDEYFQFFGERKPLPQLSFGLQDVFPSCQAAHLAGDHGQLLDPINLEQLASEINGFISKKSR